MSYTVVAIFFVFSFLATVNMAYRSAAGKTAEKIGRGGAYKLLEPATMKAQDILSGLKGSNILISWRDDFFNGGYVNGWLAYFARNNRVWISNSWLGDINLEDLPQTRWGLRKPWEDGFLLTPSMFARSVVGSSVRLIWSDEPYFLWKISGWDWAVLSNIKNPNGLERADGEDFFWVGNRDSVLEIASGRDGIIILEAKLFPGPSVLSQEVRNILITTSAGYRESKCIQSWGAAALPVPVVAGQTQIKIRGLDSPSPIPVAPGTDPRVMLLQVRGLRIHEFR